MSKSYHLVNKKNGTPHDVDQETYDTLVKRKHIHNYTVTENSEGAAQKDKYIPTEVKSMSQRIKDESTEKAIGTDSPEPKPEIKLPETKQPAKPGGNKK